MANRGKEQWTANALRKGGALHKGWHFAFDGGQLPVYVASLFLANLQLPFEVLDFACGRHRNMCREVCCNLMDISWHESLLMIFIHSHDDTSWENVSYLICSSSSCDQVLMTYHEREERLHSEELNDLKLHGRHFKLPEA